MKMNFQYFQIQKWISETARLEKVDEKMGSFVLLPWSSETMGDYYLWTWYLGVASRVAELLKT